MRDRFLGIAITVAGVAMVIATVIAAGGNVLARHPLTIAGLGFTLVGGLIIYKTGHRIGWLAACTGLLFSLNELVNELPDGPIVNWLRSILWGGALLALALLVFWFPTGQAVSPRWVWMTWTALAAFVAGIVVQGQGPLATAVHWVANTILAVGLVMSLASIVVRYIRSTGTVRQQIKWFMFSVMSVGVYNVIYSLTAERVPIPSLVWDLALVLVLLGFPVSIGVAILRFRLFEIDRLVSRTVTYLIVIGLMALVFVALTWLPWILVIGVGAEGSTPPLIIAGATLVAAALFNPLRKRVQRRVERRFNRSHYDATAVAEKFGEDLRDTHDVDEIIGRLAAVVSATLSPASITAWARTRDA